MRHGNPQFTNTSGSCFEKVVEDLNLSPCDYLTSPELRDWVFRNKGDKYVPSDLLEAFGFEVGTES